MHVKEIRMKNKIAVFILMLVSMLTFAQQDAQYTQYMYNTQSVNPAYAGSRHVLSITGLHRSQWVGLEGAPRTQTFTANSPINNNVGLGVSIVNDKIGPATETYLDIDFSYTLRLNEETFLALGLKAGGNLLDVNLSALRSSGNPSFEPRYQEDIDNKFSPNFGIGAYLYKENYYLGLSVPDLLETKHYDRSSDSDSQSFLASEKMHAYLIGGYVWDLNYDLKFKPAFLLKAVAGAPLQVDMSANMLINETFSLGAAYRWSAAISGLVGFQISRSLLVGYAYDFDTNGLSDYNSGSHEIFLRWEFMEKVGYDSSARFF
jgi:type IX secretion system PorP/SprF family membrane protein